MTNKQMKVFKAAYDKLASMEDGKLSKGLSLADFDLIYTAMHEMYEDHKAHAETISQNVADWFRKNKFDVQECGIGWTISLP
jgi:hypothetical protein